MSIRIQTQDTFIPVELGDLTLKFDISDESLINLRRKMEDVQNVAKNIKETSNDEEVIEQVKSIIGKAYDEVFGKGTYDKVYEVSPSVFITTQYFMEIAQGLNKEMENRGFTVSTHEKAKQYLAKKK